jgi:hypothetical protein
VRTPQRHGAQRRCACARAPRVVFQPAHPTSCLGISPGERRHQRARTYSCAELCGTAAAEERFKSLVLFITRFAYCLRARRLLGRWAGSHSSSQKTSKTGACAPGA